MVRKKLNKKKLLVFIISIIVIIVFIIVAIALNNRKNSIEYKLETLGYTQEESVYIIENLKEEEINIILQLEYNDILIDLLKEDYFKFPNLDKYIDYYNETKNITAKEVIVKINTHTNLDFYEEIKEADLSKNELVLVNKYYKLAEDYKPSDLVAISRMYAYEDRYISESILNNITNLIDVAKNENLNLIVSTGYRSYESQEEAYNTYKISNGITLADSKVARPGHSDYQTGLALDIQPYVTTNSNVEESEEYLWLVKNAHKYGFIHRYPKDKEDITGFEFNPWRLRYVGVEAATFIYNKNITFEEYYAYKY